MKDTIVTLKEKRSHSFLLDKTGLPVFVGNPTHGKDIRVFSYDDDVQECDRPERKKNYHRLWYYSYLFFNYEKINHFGVDHRADRVCSDRCVCLLSEILRPL